MPTTTRDRTEELRALEELWAAPAAGELQAPSRRFPLVPGALVAGGWATFFFVALTFQPAPGFAAATLAGPLGIALAVNCRASEHHLGNWWLVELAAAVALTGLAAVGLAQRLRR